MGRLFGRKQKNTKRESASKMIGRSLSFAATEAYKLLRANLMFALPDERRCRVIGITSSESGEGKSITALNLSYMLAEDGNKVMLVEADMRLPGIHKRLSINQSPGLSNLLAGLCNGNVIVQKTSLHDRIRVVACGDVPPNPSELLGSEQMKITIDVFSQSFDFVVLDLPPVNEVSDALVASRLTDGILMVVRQNQTTRHDLETAMRRLKYGEAKLLGFVMTCAESGNKAYKKYSYYGYGEEKPAETAADTDRTAEGKPAGDALSAKGKGTNG